MRQDPPRHDDGERRIPAQPLRPSAIERHELLQVTARTWVKPMTTMVLPGVSIEEDIAAINRGEGSWLGNNRWKVHDRVYADKGNGQLYPESGDRVIAVPRLELIALKHLIEMGGDVESWNRMPGHDPNLNIEGDTIRKRVIELHHIWQRAQDGEP